MPDRLTEAEFLAIYRHTIGTLYAYASRKCGGARELAEDVTQETWLRAAREWRRSGAPDNPQAWLITVARNLILNHLRKRESLSLDVVSPAEVLAAVEENDVGDSVGIASAVNHALARIPEGEATLLEAFHFQRMKMAQLAEAHGVSERAIEGRLRRARERLRAELLITLKAEGHTG